MQSYHSLDHLAVPARYTSTSDQHNLHRESISIAMAEAAAVAAVYETVETTAQLGVGAYMVAKPTMPLKATFKQIATSSDDQTKY